MKSAATSTIEDARKQAKETLADAQKQARTAVKDARKQARRQLFEARIAAARVRAGSRAKASRISAKAVGAAGAVGLAAGYFLERSRRSPEVGSIHAEPVKSESASERPAQNDAAPEHVTSGA
jgi:hypothetical protein